MLLDYGQIGISCSRSSKHPAVGCGAEDSGFNSQWREADLPSGTYLFQWDSYSELEGEEVRDAQTTSNARVTSKQTQD